MTQQLHTFEIRSEIRDFDYFSEAQGPTMLVLYTSYQGSWW